jgi:hypothetical protein
MKGNSKSSLTYIGCSFCRLIGLPEHLFGRHDISRQTEGHSFSDHVISGSVSVTPSSVIEASIVVCVFLTCVSQCPISLRAEHPLESTSIWAPSVARNSFI